MTFVAFALLIAALVLFLFSTRQWRLWVRGLVWAAGLALLVIASVIVASDADHGGIFRAFGDLAAHWYEPSQSVLAQSLAVNGRHIGRFVLPLLDLFLIIGALLGVLALVAFTPGETLERIARPLAIGLVGAIFGGVLALSIVGTGFGNVAEQRVYSTYIQPEAIPDGDTLLMGEVSVRLSGIDAPESEQTCRLGAGLRDVQNCGAEATRYLRDLVRGALVTCIVEEDSEGNALRSQEIFARPLVTCRAFKDGQEPFNIAERLVADGYAIEYKNEPGRYVASARVARELRRGILDTCTLRPDLWRSDQRSMAAFRDQRTLPRDRTLVVGVCPPPQRPRQQPGVLATPD